jgi:hypothetical protein
MLVFIGFNTYAQKAEDALRYSQSNYFSSARSASMAGAFGALGGDFSSIRINPAGLGIYRHNEISFTQGLSFINAEQSLTTENNQNFNVSNDTKSFNLGQIGAVFVIKNEAMKANGFDGIKLGFGYNLINNFDREYFGSSYNANNSFLDWTVQYANGTAVESLYKFSDRLINDAQLIQNTGDEANSYATALKSGEKVNQYKKVKESGYQGEYLLSIATNYKRKLYFGVSLGIEVLDYTNSSIYSESTLDGSKSPLNHYSFYKDLNQSGWGLNAKLGIIYKPIQNLSLGLAVHTSTSFDIDEEYYTSVDANYKEKIGDKQKKDYSAKSPFNTHSYTYEKPFKLVASGAYIFGQRALISADVEYINYPKAEFSLKGNKDSYEDTNSEIDETYNAAINFRIGGEFRINSLFNLRAGYAFQDSPYEKGTINDNSQENIFTGGLGFRYQNFFANFAYVRTQYNDSYVFYNYNDGKTTPIISSLIEQKISSNDFMLSVGLNF